MPELPEVQTTVTGLNAKVVGKKIIDVWTDIASDTPKLPHHKTSIKSAQFFNTFKKEVIGATIIKAQRKGKNIFILLSNKKTIWIHMKMTGHMMYGAYAYNKKENVWSPDKTEKNNYLRDPFNKYLHFMCSLSNGKHLVLSDVRKFAKVTLINTSDINIVTNDLGPDPLDETFTRSHFEQALLKKPTRAIKEVLLDQKIISGIGNIYSDEMLWLSNIHPLRLVQNISKKEFSLLYKSMIEVLSQGIHFGGDSTSDYRDINGRPGDFQHTHNAYRKTGLACIKKSCTGTIERIAFFGRGAHFCPVHQK